MTMMITTLILIMMMNMNMNIVLRGYNYDIDQNMQFFFICMEKINIKFFYRFAQIS